MDKKWVCLLKKEISLKRKSKVWRGFSELIEILFVFCIWRVLIQKNGEATERRGSIVKRGKIRVFLGGWGSACKNPVRVSIYVGHKDITKLLNTFG